ncbi:MAG: PocR ligand-binding domain-containing protein [Oscillospiraceae bacterium]|nr:PocR ligand-binding domain-containing protein [Oscillospiraceae bacterium]
MHHEDLTEIISLLKELHIISGFRISVHDTKFREIQAYPSEITPFCRLVQKNKKGLCRCLKNDKTAFERASSKAEVYLYKCCFGLYEAVAPLYIMGNIVGYLMMGQMIDNSPGSREAIIKNAADFVDDRKKLEIVADSVMVCDKQKILSCMKILDICAQYITLSKRIYLNKSDISEKIKDYIDQNYAQNITIESICLKFFCSRTHAMTAFKANYGIGIIEYLTRVRIQAAKRLLNETTKKVKEIAENCGYHDQNYFSKVFFKKCGMTPTAYRQLNNAN